MCRVGWIAEYEDVVCVCIKEEFDSIVGIVAIYEEKLIFTLLNLVLGLFVKNLDPFSADFSISPPLPLIANSKCPSERYNDHNRVELTKH